MDWWIGTQIGGILMFQDNIKSILDDGVWRGRPDLFSAMSKRRWRFTFKEFRKIMNGLEERGHVRTTTDHRNIKTYQNPLTASERELTRDEINERIRKHNEETE